ncbi:MAG: glycosyltransferase [Synergistaceae bacterium]|nr:glycosyltransferase [Synergistaceae bacterium]
MRILNYVDSNELSFRIPWIGLMKELERRGTEQVLLCRPGGNMEQAARVYGVPIRTWAPVFPSAPFLNCGYPSVAREIAPDIVLTRLSSAAAIAGFWGKRLGIPTVAMLDKESKAKYFRNADHYVSCSRWIKDAMASRGIPEDRIDVVHNSIDPERYARDSVVREEFRKSLGISSDEKVFVGIGMFNPEKSFDILVRAFFAAAGRRDDIRLLLVGDGPLRPSYLKLIDKLGVSGRVVVSEGFVDDVRPWLWGADYYVMPSSKEGFGIAALEAIAAGLPMIVSNTGGLLDIVADGESCIMAEAGNADSFAKAMLTILDMDEASIGRMLSGSMSRLSYFTNEALADRMIGVYRSVLDRRLR